MEVLLLWETFINEKYIFLCISLDMFSIFKYTYSMSSNSSGHKYQKTKLAIYYYEVVDLSIKFIRIFSSSIHQRFDIWSFVTFKSQSNFKSNTDPLFQTIFPSNITFKFSFILMDSFYILFLSKICTSKFQKSFDIWVYCY